MFLLKIERSIVEREIRKERIEITSAKEIRVIGYQNPSPFRMQLLGFFSIRTSHRFHEYMYSVHSYSYVSFPLGGNSQGLEIHHDGGDVAAYFTVSLVGRRD